MSTESAANKLCKACGKPLAWHRENTDSDSGMVATVRMVRLDDGTLQVCDANIRPTRLP